MVNCKAACDWCNKCLWQVAVISPGCVKLDKRVLSTCHHFVKGIRRCNEAGTASATLQRNQQGQEDYECYKSMQTCSCSDRQGGCLREGRRSQKDYT